MLEALQFLKCLFQKDLIFWEPLLSSILKEEYSDVLEDYDDPDWVDEDPDKWDKLIIDVDVDRGDDDLII